jgi:gas vesicle protein
MSSEKALLGILAGLAIGAIAGILLAPEKGSVTRRFISKKSKKYVGNLEEKFNGLIDTLNEKIESVKEQAADFVNSDKNNVEQNRL